jgi:DNA-binding transcriptional ArsR family regulator
MIGPSMGTKPPPGSLGGALFGLTKQRVLALLFGRPDSRFFVNEIVREARIGKGTVQRELALLESAGIIESRVEGRQRYYRASPDSPVFPELEALIRKTFGLGDVLANALAPLKSRIQFAGVYGSVARGTANARSDVDLLVIGSVEYLELAAALVEPETLLRRPINPTLFSHTEWRSKLATPTGFVRELVAGPMMPIIGALDELAESGKGRSAPRAGGGSRGNRKAPQSRAPKARRRKAR